LEASAQPTHIGRYEIRGELGRGMMGVVYEAHDPALGRSIALKTIRLALAATDGERVDFERRFLTEARIAARLSHPGIVVVHDVGRDAEHGILYIALEHLPGRTLAERVTEGPLTWRDALQLVGRVAEALSYAHKHGVVHRDVKPANIMVLPTSEPKIMDFGIAKLETAHVTSPGQFFGTPLYMSPEQALGQAVDARTDLFSLGSVAYLLLAGHPPFEAPSVPGILARVAYQHAQPLSELGREIPPEAEYVVGRAMAKNPEDRYPDGRTMAEDIDDVLAGHPPRHRAGWLEPEVGDSTIVAGAALAPARPRRRRRNWPLRLALVLLLGAVTGSYFYTRPGDARFWRRIVDAAKRAAVVPEPETLGARSAEPAAGDPPATDPTVLSTAGPGDAAAPADPPAAVDPAATTPGEPAEPGLVTSTATAIAASVDAPPAPDAAAAGQLAIDFEHHLRQGRLQVWVDGTSVFDAGFDAQDTRRILAFTLRHGIVQEVVPLPAGSHEVTVRVQWEKNVRTARISGTFEPGGTRRLDVSVARLGGGLSLRWR
jgi:eukaryotic-like serine/threonine-protein kinase